MQYSLKRWKVKYQPALEQMLGGGGLYCMPDKTAARSVKAADFIKARLLADDEKELCRALLDAEQVCGSIECKLGEGLGKKTARLTIWTAGQPDRAALADAVQRLCAAAFRQLDIVRIEALPLADDIASRSMLNEAGFALESTMRRAAYDEGKIKDICVYAMFRA